MKRIDSEVEAGFSATTELINHNRDMNKRVVLVKEEKIARQHRKFPKESIYLIDWQITPKRSYALLLTLCIILLESERDSGIIKEMESDVEKLKVRRESRYTSTHED